MYIVHAPVRMRCDKPTMKLVEIVQYNLTVFMHCVFRLCVAKRLAMTMEFLLVHRVGLLCRGGEHHEGVNITFLVRAETFYGKFITQI